RRIEGRRMLESVVYDPALRTAAEASRYGRAEPGRGKLATVVEWHENGPIVRDRLVLAEGDVVPFDQVIVRRTSPVKHAESERDAELALAAYSPQNLAWPDAPAGALEFMRSVYEAHVRRSAGSSPRGMTFVDNVPASQLRVLNRPESGYTDE